MCGRRVLKSILKEDAIYFSVMCDATSDISHTEQNVVLIRYLKCNKEANNWEINERFFEFKNFFKKTGSEIAEMIENLLYDKGDIGDCRGQGYDYGANMSGKVKRVQAQILKEK